MIDFHLDLEGRFIHGVGGPCAFVRLHFFPKYAGHPRYLIRFRFELCVEFVDRWNLDTTASSQTIDREARFENKKSACFSQNSLAVLMY